MNELGPGDRDAQSHVVPVTPLLQGRAVPILPRVLIATVLVGVIAFVAAIQLGGRHRSDPAVEVAVATPTVLVAAPTGSPSATTSPVIAPVIAPVGASAFASRFVPQAAIAGIPGGAACVTSLTGAPGFTTAASSRTLVRAWVTACPLAARSRAAFLDRLMSSLTADIPGSVSGVTQGYKGMTLLYYLYSDGPFNGTVVITLRASGSSLLIASTLEEGSARR